MSEHTIDLDGFEASCREHTTRRQELGQQGHCSEQLSIGIVESELNEDSTRLIVDPLQMM